MHKKTWYDFMKSHHLVDRCYDMLDYFLMFEQQQKTSVEIKKRLYQKLSSPYFVESLSHYFEKQLKKNRHKIETYCNLKDLIYDLDCFKQYL